MEERSASREGECLLGTNSENRDQPLALNGPRFLHLFRGSLGRLVTTHANAQRAWAGHGETEAVTKCSRDSSLDRGIQNQIHKEIKIKNSVQAKLNRAEG